MGFSKWVGGIKWFASFLNSFNSYVKTDCRKYSVIGFLLLCNAAFYLYAVYSFSDFSSDDFYIFSLIRNNPAHPVSFNPNEVFFLFFRPVSYFSFWVNYHLFFTDALLMKVFSIAIHLVVVSVVYFLLISITEYFKIKKNDLLLTAAILILSFHPDVMMYILYINNRTELLMLLFYSASLLVIFTYLNDKIRLINFIPIVIVLFMLSILSKQTGMHLPFIILTGTYLLGNINPEKKKVLLSTGIVLAFITILYSYLNYLLSGSDTRLLDSLWKKPFSMTGTLLFVFVPAIAEEIYTWSMMNMEISVSAGIIIIIASSIWLKRKFNFKILITGGILFISLFFPRMFSSGGGRINSHLVLWSVIIVVIVCSKMNLKYAPALVMLYAALTMVYSLKIIDNNIELQRIRISQIVELTHLELNSKRKIFPVLTESAAFLNEYYYHREQSFGMYDNKIQPLIYKYLFPGIHQENKSIRCRRNGNVFEFKSNDPQLFIGENPINRSRNLFPAFPSGNKNREYCRYSVILPDSIINTYTLVFHNGLSWEIVK